MSRPAEAAPLVWIQVQPYRNIAVGPDLAMEGYGMLWPAGMVGQMPKGMASGYEAGGYVEILESAEEAERRIEALSAVATRAAQASRPRRMVWLADEGRPEWRPEEWGR